MALAINASAQIQVLSTKKYQKSHFQMLTSDEFPKDKVITALGSILQRHGLLSIENLTEKEIRTIRKFAKKHNSSKVFVDFSGALPLANIHGHDAHVFRLNFYVLQDLDKVVAKPQEP